MMTERTHTSHRTPSRRPNNRKEEGAKWKLFVLTGALGVYLALFAILPKVDASRQTPQTTTKSVAQNVGGAAVQVRDTHVVLAIPPLTPLAVPTDLRVSGGSNGNVGISIPGGNPAVPAVQVAPMPTIAPLPQMVAPIVRSRGS